MLALPSEVRFWSTQDEILLKSTDYSCYKYYSRKEQSDQIYEACKRKYLESRGVGYVVSNKRPEKLRDKLREFEEALSQNKVVCHTWNTDVLQLLLSRGLLVSVRVNGSDLVALSFDRSLVSKVQPELIADGVITGGRAVCVCKDGRLIGKDWVIESSPRRNLSAHGDLLAVWGRTGCEHPQPWSPLAKDHQRANLHLYWIGSRGPDLLSYKKTDGEPIKVAVSKVKSRSLVLVELKVSQRGAVSVEVSALELFGATLKRTAVTAVPLQTQVSCSSLSENETYLLLGCIDGSLAILDRRRGSTRIVRTPFIPTHVTWHASEAMAAICNEKGRLQYYDAALNCVGARLLDEDFSSAVIDVSCHFTDQRNVESLFWGPEHLFIVMERGPMIVLTHDKASLDFHSLTKLYLYAGKVEHAIRLLLSWTFNEQAFGALQLIVAHIMRTPIDAATAKLLQDALGSFHCPSVPLSAEVRHKFGSQVKALTRRFFHQLVRAQMYETAFLLAVDLGHHDLFMDLHYIAIKIGETEMAAAARAQASSLLSRCSSEASNCSRSLCSQCSDSSSETSEDYPKDESKPQHSNDNYLSTNFNNPIPKTYRPIHVPPIPNVDLPKIKLLSKPFIPAPPLPSAPMNTLGIPFVPRTVAPSNTAYSSETCFVPIRSVTPPQSRVLRVAPPLPTQQPKKPQPKVKFSDTVTAFIVPEVKRPVRIPPPAHLTDPQKELADSLPLCHPNEDYLKDFTPVKKDESPPAQPKIKVVHFGVV